MAYVSYLFIPPSLHPDQVVVAVDVPLEQAIRIDSFCHANGIAFIRVRQHERGEEMADPGDALCQCPEWNALHLPCQLEPVVSPVWCQLRRPTSAACSHPFSATLDRSSLSTMWMVSGLWKWLVVRDARTPGHGQLRSLHSFSKCLSSQHYKSRMQSPRVCVSMDAPGCIKDCSFSARSPFPSPVCPCPQGRIHTLELWRASPRGPPPWSPAWRMIAWNSRMVRT